MPPKSILKKKTADGAAAPGASTEAAATDDTSSAKKPPNPRHLQVALHHANLLEERKRVEAQVLDSVITLMDFPTSPAADPKRPSPADALLFREAMIPFTPADYDALIEERNITDKCGYTLCPRPKKKIQSRGKKHFVDTAHGVEIVDRKTLEVWCSDDCAKRALYVKVQLKEEPAWMRQGGYGDNIEIMVENEEEHKINLPLRLKQDSAPVADEEAELAEAWAAQEEAMKNLSLERGEKPGQPGKANKDLIQAQITERASSLAPPQAPSLPSQASNHTMAIEGHVPRIDKKDKDGDNGSDSDDNTGDWDLPG